MSAEQRKGYLAAIGAFLIWGMLPLYLKWLAQVPIWQIAANRVLWGCVFALIWVFVQKHGMELLRTLRNSALRRRMMLTSLLLTVNWTVYMWGVLNGHVIDTSLGYFINPLMNVLLGVVILSERLNRIQWTSVAIATCGVLYLTWTTGHAPWIAITLAASFAFYGLLRKTARVEALVGLTTETLLLVPFAIGYLYYCHVTGVGVIEHADTTTVALLVLSGAVTAIPLTLFAIAARQLPYTTVGLLQYLSPTLQLIIAVLVFHESFSGPRVIGFVCIWIALALYAADGLWRTRSVSRVSEAA